MSTAPESGSPELGLDLDLHFLPAWAQKPAENKYAKYEGVEDRGDRPRGDRRERRFDRGPRRPEGRGPGGPGAPGGPRGDRGPGREGGRPRGQDFRSRGQDRGRRPERLEPPPPPVEVNVSFIPEEKGVESLARQIRLTGRAYPLFDIGFLILKKPDRYVVRFEVIKKPDGQVAQPLFVCALDETLWLSEQGAIDYVLGKHFTTFYQPERTPTEPPKGTYTFVAQCGMSGTILGPPNYHDYQNKLRKLHAERFSRMPFEMFKARIRIVRDEAVVKKWLEDQSWKTEYVCLNVPDTLKLGTREEVEQHFRQTHMANVIKPVESHTLGGPAAQGLPTAALQRLVRRSWDEQMRFPLKLVNVLSQQFAGHGLQFFKVNKTVTHVSVARPRYLDLELTPVSEGVRRIVDFIQATPQCTRRKILEALVPVSLTPAPAVPVEPGAPAAEPTPTPELAVVNSDLHWLIHQGHVIEFASGLIELAKKPIPRPPKLEKPEAAAPSATSEGQAPAWEATAPPVTTEAVPEAPASAEAAVESPQPTEPGPEPEQAAAQPEVAAPEPVAELPAPEIQEQRMVLPPAEPAALASPEVPQEPEAPSEAQPTPASATSESR
ncbi:MAG: hypothetical protein AB9869_32660 [Verrucomicrobiia bacterium]